MGPPRSRVSRSRRGSSAGPSVNNQPSRSSAVKRHHRPSASSRNWVVPRLVVLPRTRAPSPKLCCPRAIAAGVDLEFCLVRGEPGEPTDAPRSDRSVQLVWIETGGPSAIRSVLPRAARRTTSAPTLRSSPLSVPPASMDHARSAASLTRSASSSVSMPASAPGSTAQRDHGTRPTR